MKSNGITLTSSPQNGNVTINYDELEASNAKRFVALYIDAEAPEYDGDLDGEELPESILAAAIAFNRALQVLHFVPEMSVQWLIDNVPGVYEETVRRYAEQVLGMVRAEKPLTGAEVRVSAVGFDDKIVQLEQAMAGADTNMVVNTLYAYFDGDDLMQITGGLQDMIEHNRGFDESEAA